MGALNANAMRKQRASKLQAGKRFADGQLARQETG
jgi:hypothetical protein